MEIPKYISELLRKRAKYAVELNHADMIVSSWLDLNVCKCKFYIHKR